MTRPRRGRGEGGPRRVADSLDDVLAGILPPPASGASPPRAATIGTVFSRWEEVVGESLARHARPLRLEDGALVVAVDQPPWATQVRALAAEILAALAERTDEPLERLVVVVRG